MSDMTYPLDVLASGGGFKVQGTTGEAVQKYDVLSLSAAGVWVPAGAGDTARMPASGMAMEAIGANGKGTILLYGIVHNNAWSWTPGGDLYVGTTAGSIVQTLAEYISIQRAGTAITATLIHFNPGDFTLTSPLPFQVTAGGAAAGIVAANFLHGDANPKGWEIDAATEWVIAYGHLPSSVRSVLRVKVYGVALAAPGAGNGMLIDFLMNAGAPNDVFTAESISIAGKRTNEINFGVNDVVSWTFTAADDADIGDLTAFDNFEIKIMYAAAGGTDIATDAVFRSIGIEYL